MSGPPVLLLDHWRSLRGTELEEAMLTARWYAHQDEIVGWCISVSPEPPDVGYPTHGGFLGRVVAEHIAELHNAALADAEMEA